MKVMAKTFFENPDFVSYIRLLGELHQLIREGRDEGLAGEELRDRMDAPGERLSLPERTAVKEIAADFYSLTDSPGDVPPDCVPGEDLVRAVVAAYESRQVLEALQLVRHCEDVLPPARIAEMRAKTWQAANESTIARMFFNRAAQLDRHAFSVDPDR